MTTANEAWLHTISTVCREGDPDNMSNRNGANCEFLNHTLEFDMQFPFVTNSYRNINFKYVAAESHWTIMGSNRLSFNESLQRTLPRWSDTGDYLQGAYGPAFVLQLPYLVRALRNNHGTRQAVCTIWERNPYLVNDMPCLVSLQFLIRKGKLNLIANMRSSDVWLGLPNDMTVFAMMAACIIAESRIPSLVLGTCYLNAGSRHIYRKDLADCEKALGVDDPLVETYPPFSVEGGLPSFMHRISRAANAEVRARAREILVEGLV